jgi:CARDB
MSVSFSPRGAAVAIIAATLSLCGGASASPSLPDPAIVAVTIKQDGRACDTTQPVKVNSRVELSVTVKNLGSQRSGPMQCAASLSSIIDPYFYKGSWVEVGELSPGQEQTLTIELQPRRAGEAIGRVELSVSDRSQDSNLSNNSKRFELRVSK